MGWFLKLLGISLLVLILLLIPVLSLYAATLNSLPGERTYGIKRSLENYLLQTSTIQPGFFANVSLIQTQRRYQEVMGLLDKEQDSSDAVNQLLDQAKKTLFDIQTIPDQNLKNSLVSQHKSLITNYQANFNNKANEFKDLLGVDHSVILKTFKVNQYLEKDGVLVPTISQIPLQDLTTKKAPPNKDYLIKQIEVLEDAQQKLSLLLK